MALYILDDKLRRMIYVERFISLIWTERFSAYGDFQLDIQANNTTRAQFKTGVRLAYKDSYRVMVVETVEDSLDSEGRSVLKVAGTSLEAILTGRIASGTLLGTTAKPVWSLTGLPGDICRQIFQKICVDGLLSPDDIIPFITPGTIFPPDTIPDMGSTSTMDLKLGTVYDTIKSICDTDNLGFRLVRNGDMSELYFDIYNGSDRTSNQTALTPVIFGKALDNLVDGTELSSIATTKNVAYVYAPNGAIIVRPTETALNVTGFERKVLLVDANDVTLPAGAELGDILAQRGHAALAQTQDVMAFDGQVSQYGKYVYGTDYNLGDLVEMQSLSGMTKKLRVTEHIYAEDANGKRSYPTLMDLAYISPGTWYGWDFTHMWADETVYTWDDLKGLS